MFKIIVGWMVLVGVIGCLSLVACSTAPKKASETLDAVAVGTTIFAASDTTCNPGLGNQFLGCKAFTGTMPSSPVTIPAIPFLKQIPVERTYTVTFKCFSPEPVVAALSVADKTQKILSSVEGLAQSIVIFNKAGEAATATVTIPKHEISVDRHCKLIMLSEVAMPDVPFLKAFVDYVGPQLKAFTQAYVSLRVDSSSAEAAAAAKKGLLIIEKRLDSLIESWTEARLADSPDVLRVAAYCQEIKDTWRVGGKVDEDGSLPALILIPETLQAELKVCLTIAGDIREGDLRSAAAKLTSGGSVEDVLSQLEAGRQTLAHDLTSVDAFLSGERTRLGVQFEQIRVVVEAVLQNVKTWLGANQ